MELRTLPKIKNVEVTSYCNLDCPVCIEKKGNRKHLDLDLLEKILDKNYEVFNGSTVWLHFRGEPYMNKSLFKIIELFHQANVTTRLSTNGILLNEDNIIKTLESKLSFMVISVMTNDSAEYIRLRGSDSLSKVQSNIKRLLDQKKSNLNLKIQIMGLDYGQGEETIAKFVEFYHSMDFEVAIHKYSDRTGQSRLNPVNNQESLSEIRYPCHWCFNDLIILCDGSVTTCYYDLGAKNRIDSLENYNYSIQQLWNSDKYNEFRSKQNRLVFEKACKNCRDWVYYHPNVPESIRSYVKIYTTDGQIVDV